MMRTLARLSLGLALAVGASSSAKADTMDVTYSVLLQANIPALGQNAAVMVGTATVQYQATGGVSSGSAGNVVHGPATLVSASFAGPIDFTALGNLLTGFAVGGAAGAGGGTLASSGLLVLPSSLGASGTIHCTGAGCGLLNLTPSLVFPFGFGGATALVGVAGPASPNGSVFPTIGVSGAIGTFGGLTITGQLTLTEVARHYTQTVPEPGTALLLGAGLLALVGGAARAVRRR